MSIHDRDYVRSKNFDYNKMEYSDLEVCENGEVLFPNENNLSPKNTYLDLLESNKHPDSKYLPAGWELDTFHGRIVLFFIWFLSFISTFFLLKFFGDVGFIVHSLLFLFFYFIFIKFYAISFSYLIDILLKWD
jgi:hypothetical protein